MNIGEGEAAEKAVRLMLSGGEVAVKLTGSALKNGIALLLALRKSHRKVYGKASLVKLMRETRDVRSFQMTPEQFRQFQKYCATYKILYSAVQAQRDRNAPIDVMLPATEIERANLIFDRIRYAPQKDEPTPLREGPVKKKESRSEPSSRDTKDKSSTRGSAPRTTSEKPSVEERLIGFKAQTKGNAAPARTRVKTRKKGRVK